MRQFIILLKKEFQESWRSFKLLWIPLVFVSLGIMDPITNYYMEDILNAVGYLPEEFQMMWPEFSAADIIMASTSQFQMIGLIVLVAVFASSISKERQNGTATFLYVRPINYSALFFSKWVMAVIIGVLSVIAGYATSIYYTSILYGDVSFIASLKMIGTYSVWIMFVLAFSLCMSAIFKTAIAMGITLTVAIVGTLFDPVIGQFWVYSPLKLATYGVAFLEDGPDLTHYSITMGLTIGLTILFVLVGIFYARKNASTTKI